jgi:hypothetical protein
MMKIGPVVAAAAVFAIASPVCAQDAVQWRVEDGGNGHWYAFKPTGAITFWAARSAATNQGGDLASLASVAEDLWICGRGWTQVAWLGGLKAQSGDWSWLDGETWSYTRWNPCEPNDGGTELVLMCPLHCGGSQGCGSGGGWYDYHPEIHASFVSGYLIEWSADCNSDGIVDYGQIRNGTFPDVNANGVPDCCEPGESCTPCPGDVTNGGTVDAADLSILLAAWGTNGQGEFDTDLNSDGLVDGGDLALVLGGWGACP